MKTVTVVTTIFPPSPEVLAHAARSAPGRREVIVVGDEQTPRAPYHELTRQSGGVHFVSIDEQHALAAGLSHAVPLRHYARKNLGYLLALRSQATCVFDTDDDTIPTEGGWDAPGRSASVRLVTTVRAGATAVFNAYALFTPQPIWPRGFPLDAIHTPPAATLDGASADGATIGVWQGLVDGDPDVDAIGRLTRPLPPGFTFERGPGAVVLDTSVYFPFNTQNTWWIEPSLFDLLYLPSTVTSRACDILRGYVAQRCLWARGYRLGICASTAMQDRNDHRLLKDFADESLLYLRAGDLPRILDGVALDGSAADLSRCYRALADAAIVSGDEVHRAALWLEAIGAAR